ncbi:hypothetical protein N0V90_004245 [Kalmusia sp. IMI 367209]|nr:hypothetical protein N0V90_004245 [Kalmusia sp. IMI 367209]
MITKADKRRQMKACTPCAKLKIRCEFDPLGHKCKRYTEECCQVLERAEDHLNDAYLVHLIRLQRIVGKVDKTVYKDGLDEDVEMTAPLSMAISVFEDEVAAPKYAHPHSLVQGMLFNLALKMLQLHLYKFAVEDNYFPNSSYATLRANLLLACLSTTETLLETFCDLPDWAILSLPYAYWGMVGHAIKICTRLSEVKYGTWAPTVNHNQMTFARLANKIKDAMVIGQDKTPPRRLPEVFEQMEAKLHDLSQPKNQYGGSETIETGDTLLDNDMMGGILFDLLDWA